MRLPRRHKKADLAGSDAFPGETPQAVSDAQAQAPNPFDQPAPEPEKSVVKVLNWAMSPVFMSVGKREPAELFTELGHIDAASPHAYGTVEVHSNWNAYFRSTFSNMDLRAVQKRLKKFASDHGWSFEGLFDPHGYPYSFEKSDRMARVAMAERTGVPEIDALIEEYLKTPMGDWTGEDDFNEALRDPARAAGACQAVSEDFAAFAKARGYDVAVTMTDLDEMGYEPQGDPQGEVMDEHGEIVPGFYHEHTVNEVYRLPDGTKFAWPICIDWTASQYGYYEHPKISKTANDVGSGPRNPGVKDWMNKEWAGTGMWDAMPTPEQNQIGEADDSPFVCLTCGHKSPDYPSAESHRFKHVNDSRVPDGPQPVVDLDQVFPPNYNITTMDQTNLRQASILRTLTAAPSPSQIIEGPIPALFDIVQDRIFVGEPGDRHKDIGARMTPGGVVEIVYDPQGNLQLRSDTDMPYVLEHLVRLWKFMYPELPIKAIFKLVGPKRFRLAHIDYSRLPKIASEGDVIVVKDSLGQDRKLVWRDE